MFSLLFTHMENGYHISNYSDQYLIPNTYSTNYIKNCPKIVKNDEKRSESSCSSHKRRNERERFRVKMVNEAYDALRDRLPPPLCSKRMSKVETLRGAIDYIRYLESLINFC